MKHVAEVRKNFVKTFLCSLLAFFLIPGITVWFTGYSENWLDNRFLQEIQQSKQPEKGAMLAFLKANPISSVCGSTSPKLTEYRDSFCKPYSMLWQFHKMKLVAVWTLIASGVVLLSIFVLGGLAFLNKRWQTLSLMFGKRLLMLACAAEVIAQGAMAVWLSFWLTGFFLKKYYPQLILLMGIAVAIGVFFVVLGIFKKPPLTAVGGELISPDEAPVLWGRIRRMAKRLQTAPPDYIVAGIETNFFVTEAPLSVSGRTLNGRILFVSLPLLRQLETTEADAVLLHELGHMHVGDTASNAMLGPRLTQYDQYTTMMYDNPMTHVVYPLRLYRQLFELAYQRDNREREFRVDHIAARIISPQAIIHSLIKIAAYAGYRTQIELKLFQSKYYRSANLGIADAVASGLHDYVRSSGFIESMRTGNVLHPFDSHPTLIQRMQNVGYTVDENKYAEVVVKTPADTWLSNIPSAEAIEQRLWAHYEKIFAQAHEQALAYQYEPANEEETAIVLKYFPPVSFQLKQGKSIQVTYTGIIKPETAELIPWDQVRKIKYKDGIGADVLVITHQEKGLLGIGHQHSKIRLPGLKKERTKFKMTYAHYWGRHQIMRNQQAKESGNKA